VFLVRVMFVLERLGHFPVSYVQIFRYRTLVEIWSHLVTVFLLLFRGFVEDSIRCLSSWKINYLFI